MQTRSSRMSGALSERLRPGTVILLLGVLFTVGLLLQVEDEVFFAGDMGLKLLQVRAFSNGSLKLALELPGPEWVQQLWSDGLYPFRPPFVYRVDQRHLAQYPFLFSLLSAPFYAWLGFRGLYVIPLVSIWILWWRCLVVGRAMQMGRAAQRTALTALVFCSPLTLYGVMFWEHAPAVSLAFSGLSVVMVGFRTDLTRLRALMAGVLLGLSVWFRPECLCLVAIVCLLLLLQGRRNSGRDHWWPAIVGMAVPVLLFLIANRVLYGRFLGLHGRQVVEGILHWGHGYSEGFSFERHVVSAMRLASAMGRKLLVYFPVILFPVMTYVILPRPRRQVGTEARFLVALCAGLFMAIPLIMPLDDWGTKEWGPRFLLLLVGPIALLVGLCVDVVEAWPRSRRRVAVTCLAGAMLAGLGVNTCAGAIRLTRDRSWRVLPTVRLLRDRPEKVVAVSLQHIAQETATLVGSKYFFLTRDGQAVQKLAERISEQGLERFLYIRHIDHDAYVPEVACRPLAVTHEGRGHKVLFDDAGQQAKYRIYRATITPEPTSWAPADAASAATSE